MSILTLALIACQVCCPELFIEEEDVDRIEIISVTDNHGKFIYEKRVLVKYCKRKEGLAAYDYNVLCEDGEGYEFKDGHIYIDFGGDFGIGEEYCYGEIYKTKELFFAALTEQQYKERFIDIDPSAPKLEWLVYEPPFEED